MCRAIALLAAGGAVKDVALEVGYETPSAFVVGIQEIRGNDTGKDCRAPRTLTTELTARTENIFCPKNVSVFSVCFGG